MSSKYIKNGTCLFCMSKNGTTDMFGKPHHVVGKRRFYFDSANKRWLCSACWTPEGERGD